LKSNKFTVTTILLLTIGIVAGPLVSKGLRTEIAHWYLAAGSNAVELGTGDASREIDLARQWYPHLTELEDYWILRVKQAHAKSPAATLDLVRNAPDVERIPLAMRVANELYESQEYGPAADAYALAFGDLVEANEDYWQLRVMEAYQEQSPQAAVLVMREALSSNPGFSTLVLRYSMALAGRLEFDAALEALELVLDSDSKETTVLNQLAYYRSLARVGLDQALDEINRALAEDKDDPALRDTRAWVLYQLERPEEALEDANFAVEAMERLSLNNLIDRGMANFASGMDNDYLLPQPETKRQIDQDSELEPSPNSTKPPARRRTTTRSKTAESDYLTSTTANPVLWNLAVLKYHRAKILEKLDRAEDAKKDWDWISKNNFPPDDRLH
jgi:tetratricopeptide (TPR) repeat protein